MDTLTLKKESARVEALYNYQILDTPPEPAFDDLVFLAAQICGTPIALINLVDTNRQWFKAKIGLDVQEMPIIGFCPFCVEKADALIVPDSWADEQFATSAVVTSEPYVRFYAGVPIIAPGGEAIGTVCVVDRVPHEISLEQIDSLKAISRQVIRQLEIRRSLIQLTNLQTEYQEAKEALHKSECTLNSFFNNAPMMMGTVEIRNDDILHICDNPPSAKFFGLTPETMKNRFASDMGIKQKYVRQWINYYEQAKQTRQPVSFEYPHDTCNGEKWLRTTVSSIAACSSSPQRFTYIVEDITQRKRVEQQVKEQAALLDITTDAIIVRDLSKQILLWNKSAQKLYGWEAASAIGKNINQLLDNESLSEGEIYHTVLEHGSWQGELQNKTKLGKRIIVDSRWTLIRDEHQQAKSILIVDTDITQKKQLETQFLRAQRMESIGTLASGIAHDLNNMLSPILMSVPLLKAKVDDERSIKILSIVESNAKRGANLVNQVLAFARGIEGDRTVLQLKHQISEMKQIIEQTFPKSITLETEIAADLAFVCGDSTQLHQVLMNLCLNARDAMPTGGTLKISAKNIFIDENFARMHLDAKVGPYIVLSVSDTGTGIHQEQLDRIFEPFFTTKEFGHGTGLGLSTVMGIIKSHGGLIIVSSSLGIGTKFRVYLPAQNTDATQIVENQEIPNGEGEWILVADDEAAIREITTISLENHNYKAVIASDGIEAIALYAQHKDKIKAAIIDMMMPNMDGATTISALKKMNSQLPIIAVSGLATNEQVPSHKTCKQATFLPKPYTAAELLQSLHIVCQGSFVKSH